MAFARHDMVSTPTLFFVFGSLLK